MYNCSQTKLSKDSKDHKHSFYTWMVNQASRDHMSLELPLHLPYRFQMTRLEVLPLLSLVASMYQIFHGTTQTSDLLPVLIYFHLPFVLH